MIVKIKKAKFKSFWYADHIDEKFKGKIDKDFDIDLHVVVAPDDKISIERYIDLDDCEIIKISHKELREIFKYLGWEMSPQCSIT